MAAQYTPKQRDRYVIIDWTGIFYPLLKCLSFCAAVLPITYTFPQYAIATLIVPALAMASSSPGTIISLSGDYIEFPCYLWRRKIKLSEIDDINMEFRTTRWKIEPFARVYCANLSSPSGRMQIRFYSKGARDQFLSIMKNHSRARITRWT